jgi:hypothetical protein
MARISHLKGLLILMVYGREHSTFLWNMIKEIQEEKWRDADFSLQVQTKKYCDFAYSERYAVFDMNSEYFDPIFSTNSKSSLMIYLDMNNLVPDIRNIFSKFERFAYVQIPLKEKK